MVVPADTFVYPGRARLFYRVIAGDGLEGIAAAFGVTATDLATWNVIDPEANLTPGLVLQVFAPEGFDAAAAMVLSEGEVAIYVVGSTEHLEHLAREDGRERIVCGGRGDTVVDRAAVRNDEDVVGADQPLRLQPGPRAGGRGGGLGDAGGGRGVPSAGGRGRWSGRRGRGTVGVRVMSAVDPDRPRVLVVDDEDGIRTTLEVLFRRSGYDVTVATDGRRGIAAVRAASPFDLVVTDLVMPGSDGIEVLRAAKERSTDTQVIVITAHATVDTALATMRLGAHDYVQKPYAMEEMRVRAERALEKRRLIGENAQLRARVAGRHSFGEIVARSERMAAVIAMCRRAAQIPTNVLITGESGTGKELASRAIHHEGTRAGKPFVVVDCGSIPETLIESELFGHMRGAFTGAVGAQPGLFRSAEAGTVFLDEIAELPLAMQVKLLRVLQERVVKPVGSVEEIAVDVRVIAATNRDLEAEVQAGRFREDLFYRLNVLRVEMPPLRDRPADIQPLAELFLRRYAEQLGRG